VPLADSWVPVILAVGRLTEQKDYPTLLYAINALLFEAELDPAVPPVRLVILGTGRLESSLRSLARDLGVAHLVRFEGFQPNPYAYMRRADAFVLTSRWEGFPNVLVEAMACGVPVIATDCPGASAEILEYGRWGELVPVGDAVALAAAIRRMLNTDEKHFAEARALEFTPERILPQYEMILGVGGTAPNTAPLSGQRQA